MRRGHGWLCAGPAAFCLLDAAVTLAGQPAAYWQGDFAAAVEFNPAGLWLLRWHPAVFGAALLAWLVLFAGLILWLPGGWARGLSLAVLFGHTLGLASWAVGRAPYGWLVCVGLFLLAAEVMAWTWKRAARTP
jgi:hypothetical protein